MKLNIEVKKQNSLLWYLIVENALFADYEQIGDKIYFCGVFEYHNNKLEKLEKLLYESEQAHEPIRDLIRAGGGNGIIEI